MAVNKIRKKDMVKILKAFIIATRNAKEITEFTCEVDHDTKGEMVPPYFRIEPTGWVDVRIKVRFLSGEKRKKETD